MSPHGSNDERIDHSMLDCPLAIHTSPTSTFFSEMLFLPVTFSSSGPPASSLSSFTIQVPRLAFVETVLPRNSTVTFSPSSAHPQIGTAVSRCNTMLSENKP